MERDEARHTLLQPLPLIADDILRNGDLVERLGMHEVETHVVFVEIIVVLFIEIGALDLVGRPVALEDLHAVADTSHFEMRDGRSLAGVNVFRVHHNGKPALEIEHIAFADRACNNFHHQWSPFSKFKRRGHLIGRSSSGQPAGNLRGCYPRTLQPPSDVSQSAATSPAKAQIGPMSQPSPWWNADKHADRRPFLIMRGRIKAAIRAWL